VAAKACWRAIPKSIVLVAAVYLWADTAKTIVSLTLCRATTAQEEANTGRPATHATVQRRTNAVPRAPLQTRDMCWASDPVYGIRHSSTGGADYIIDTSASGWSRLTNVDPVGELQPARIIPSYKNGIPVGFQFVWLMPNSLYDRLGFEEGDVVLRVNGYDLDGPDRVLEIYQQLRECDWFDVELERGGRRVHKMYSLR
jgi:general secretion pathway protein C